MFNKLTKQLEKIQKLIFKNVRITEDNIQSSIKEVRLALLEADVSVAATKHFIAQVKQKAIGEEVLSKLNPGQAFIGIMHDELVNLLGDSSAKINLKAQPPVVIMMVGLQGSGKTTTTAKLAMHLSKTHKVLVCSCDTQRYASREQLEILAKQAKLDYISPELDTALEISEAALKHAEIQGHEVLILDTAGRTDTDEKLMSELKIIKESVNPHETLLVIDSMIGNYAVKIGSTFNEHLDISGIVLTKIDGDSRGGAMLSLWHHIKKPIKFCTGSEKLVDIEEFDPKEFANKILNLKATLSLVNIAKKELERAYGEKTKNIKKVKVYGLNEFAQQLEQLKTLMKSEALMEQFNRMKASNPMMNRASSISGFNPKSGLAIIYSMTEKERNSPEIIKSSRKQRVSKGSCRSIQEVNRLLNQFIQSKKMIKQGSRGEMARLMKNMPKIP